MKYKIETKSTIIFELTEKVQENFRIKIFEKFYVVSFRLSVNLHETLVTQIFYQLEEKI